MDDHLFLKKIASFTVLALFMIQAYPVYAQKMGLLYNSEVIVHSEDPLQASAEEVMSIYSGVRNEVEKTLGWRVQFRPRVVLIKDSETFRRMAGTDLIVAFAVPEKDLIVIDHSKMRSHPFTIEITLKHELCHLLLHHHIKKENLPRWLDEGVAQWLSGGIAEIIMAQKGSILNGVSLQSRYLSMKSLTKIFPQDKKSLFLAYEESRSLVEYIIANFGRNGLLAVLAHLRDGEKVDEALLKTLSISLEDLEKDWQDHLKKRITWVTYLISYLYEILFFLAALITIYGFIKVWMRKRKYRG